jgi:DNA-binding XRE family transcriptional regulator
MHISLANTRLSWYYLVKSALQCASITMLCHDFGRLLRARRKSLQLRQRDVAELAGVTLRGLTEIENGRGNPTLNQISKIAGVLGLEVTLSRKPSNAAG